ncbi:MAG TPA: hypothetical protein VK401_09650 [Propionibacteriaceae bacterium]|jgi:hypothetical protein|nr:hypothetical protein [Propionibacteriaceae bacterium]
MGADDLGLLLVRPVTGDFGQPLRVGTTAAYVLVDLGEPAEQPPLARCRVVYLGQGRMQVSADEPASTPVRPELSRRLLAGVADRMREVGGRHLAGTAAGGTPIDLPL